MSISTSAVRAPLHHRPFAVLGQHLEHATPAPAADAIRAEVRALVSRRAISRRDGDDLLARLGLHTMPYRWAIGATVPATTTVRAPNDRYAAHVGTGQLITVLGRLRTGYLASAEQPTDPSDHPAARSLRHLRVRRTDPCPGYPVGGVYTVTADALLAITVTGDDAATAWSSARTRLVADLDHLYGIGLDTLRLRRTGARRLSDLDHNHTDPVVPDAA
jgi:hypothetical protein